MLVCYQKHFPCSLSSILMIITWIFAYIFLPEANVIDWMWRTKLWMRAIVFEPLWSFQNLVHFVSIFDVFFFYGRIIWSWYLVVEGNVVSEVKSDLWLLLACLFLTPHPCCYTLHNSYLDNIGMWFCFFSSVCWNPWFFQNFPLLIPTGLHPCKIIIGYNQL